MKARTTYGPDALINGATLQTAHYPGTDDALACAHEWIAYYYGAGEPVLADYPKTKAFLKLHLGLKDYEVFGVLHLTTHHIPLVTIIPRTRADRA